MHQLPGSRKSTSRFPEIDFPVPGELLPGSWETDSQSDAYMHLLCCTSTRREAHRKHFTKPFSRPDAQYCFILVIAKPLNDRSIHFKIDPTSLQIRLSALLRCLVINIS